MTTQARVLFMCVANAARSQMAEALLRHMAPQNFRVFSAGTLPTEIDPRTLDVLQDKGISTDGLYAKSVDAFKGEHFDFIIMLCDKSALECHALPNAGEVIAWNFPDPAESASAQAFKSTLQEISERIKMFVLIKTRR